MADAAGYSDAARVPGRTVTVIVWPTSEHDRGVTNRLVASGSFSAWAASGTPRTLRASSITMCWKPAHVPSSGRSSSRARRMTESAPSMLRYGLPGAIQKPS